MRESVSEIFSHSRCEEESAERRIRLQSYGSTVARASSGLSAAQECAEFEEVEAPPATTLWGPLFPGGPLLSALGGWAVALPTGDLVARPTSVHPELPRTGGQPSAPASTHLDKFAIDRLGADGWTWEARQ